MAVETNLIPSQRGLDRHTRGPGEMGNGALRLVEGQEASVKNPRKRLRLFLERQEAGSVKVRSIYFSAMRLRWEGRQEAVLSTTTEESRQETSRMLSEIENKKRGNHGSRYDTLERKFIEKVLPYYIKDAAQFHNNFVDTAFDASAQIIRDLLELSRGKGYEADVDELIKTKYDNSIRIFGH